MNDLTLNDTTKIKVGETVIYAETTGNSIKGLVTEYDPVKNVVELTDIDGEVNVDLNLVFWFISEPASAIH